MRRTELAILLLPTLFVVAGCRQTTGPTTAGPLSPLAPVTPGQSPVLGPFGGNTRVTPPATGSFNTPTAYSGVAPTGYLGSNQAAAGGYASTPQSSNAIVGSGVQVAGWTETQSTFGYGPEVPFGQSQMTTSGNRDPRSGGMQVIDLTGAPNPPGYQPAYGPALAAAPQPASYGQFYSPSISGVPVAGTHPNWQSTSPAGPHGFAPVGQDNAEPTPTFRSAPLPASTFQPSVLPTSSTQIGHMTTLPPSTTGFNSVHRPINEAQVPSTEPIPGVQGDLSWRRPGVRF